MKNKEDFANKHIIADISAAIDKYKSEHNGEIHGFFAENVKIRNKIDNIIKKIKAELKLSKYGRQDFFADFLSSDLLYSQPFDFIEFKQALGRNTNAQIDNKVIDVKRGNLKKGDRTSQLIDRAKRIAKEQGVSFYEFVEMHSPYFFENYIIEVNDYKQVLSEQIKLILNGSNNATSLPLISKPLYDKVLYLKYLYPNEKLKTPQDCFKFLNLKYDIPADTRKLNKKTENQIIKDFITGVNAGHLQGPHRSAIYRKSRLKNKTIKEMLDEKEINIPQIKNHKRQPAKMSFAWSQKIADARLKERLRLSKECGLILAHNEKGVCTEPVIKLPSDIIKARIPLSKLRGMPPQLKQ